GRGGADCLLVLQCRGAQGGGEGAGRAPPRMLVCPRLLPPHPRLSPSSSRRGRRRAGPTACRRGRARRYPPGVAARVLVIDNYDSFVYNLVQYLGELGAEPVVLRNDERTVAELEALQPDAVLISPGPGTPDDAGVSLAAIEAFAGRVPLLGVCLGLQCIGQRYGG